ncbi:MAG: hypothetical protein L6R39_006981, partial [Caloplaca ligustica]
GRNRPNVFSGGRKPPPPPPPPSTSTCSFLPWLNGDDWLISPGAESQWPSCIHVPVLPTSMLPSISQDGFHDQSPAATAAAEGVQHDYLDANKIQSMSAPSKKQGPMDFFIRQRKSGPPPTYEKEVSDATGPRKPSVHKSGYASSLWEAAAARSKTKFPQELTDADPSSVLSSVYDEAKARQNDSEKKQWKVKKPGKNGEEVKLRDIYGAIASCATRFRDVGDLVVQADPVHTALPWVVIRTCLTAGINEHEMYGIMMQGLEMISGLVTHYIVIEQIFVVEDTDHTRAVKNSLLTLYTAVLDFLLEALDYFPPIQHEQDEKHWLRHKLASGAGKAKRAFRSLDPSAQAAAKARLESVSKAKANVDADANHAYATKNMELLGEFGAAQDSILKQLQKSGLGQEEVKRRLTAMQRELIDPLYSIDDKVSSLYTQLERTQQQGEVARVLDWLSPAAQESRRRSYHKSLSSPSYRFAGYGQWLLEHPEYLQWQKSKTSSVCCLSGIEGTGKTTLLSVVIDQLKREISDNGESDHLAFFYASAQEGSFWSKPDEVMRSIVRQLSVTQAGTNLEPATKQEYDNLMDATNEPSRPVMSECVDITLALTNYFPVVIVIDGLDELQAGNAADRTQSSRNDLIESLVEVVRKSSNPMKLLFSVLADGSAEARLRRVFANTASDDTGSPNNWHTIEVNASRNSEEIGAYVDIELTKRISSGDLLGGEVDEELKGTIKDRLLERSNGMFSYAAMQIDHLCDDRMDKTTVVEELDKPLPGITTLYDSSVEQIRNETIDRVRITAQNTLRWLLCIQDPSLPLHAFLEALVVEGGIDKPKESNLHSACRRLVKTDRAAGVLVLRHPSVREHLVRIPEYSESDCHLAAAERCIRMMITASSSIARLSPAQVRFYWYAKLYWSLHYQKIGFDSGAENKALNEERRKAFLRVKELVRKFLMQGHKTSPAFNKWMVQIPDFVKELGEDSPLSKQLKSLQASLDDPLHVICVFGLAPIIEAHYKHLDFTRRNIHGQTSLCLAVENKQVETVKALLTHGRVDPNEFNVKAVHQLQQQDFLPVICYASALQAAAVHGSIPIIQTLLDHGARIGLVAGYYGSALQAACCEGHDEVVNFLLTECNADPNSQGGYYGNALQAAAAEGHREIVERLLEVGACETASGGHYGSVMMAATCAGSKDIIECLLAHTAHPKILVNMKSQTYGTPLQRAADMDRVDIVDLLIANDADINALGGTGSKSGSQNATSALAIAAWGGHRKIVSILCGLGAEADLSYTAKEFHLLHQAAIHNMLDLVNYCLDSGCDANMGTDKGPRYHDMQGYLTPLSFASAEGHLEVVQVLLQHGARIYSDRTRVTSLHLAARKAHCHVIEALINEHKSRHANNGQETLHFINRGIDGSGSTALNEAVHGGAHDALSLLLANGASFIGDFRGVGPLHVAAWEGRPRIAKILVSHLEASGNSSGDGQINARNRWGKTPLIDAAHRNRIRVFEFLLRHGADYKVKDNDQNSLLHYVTSRNHHEILEMLLDTYDKEEPETKAGLLAATNRMGNTPLQEALHKQHFQTVRPLLAAGTTVTPSRQSDYLFRVAPGTKLKVVQRFIGAFEDYPEELVKFLNHRNRADGCSMLHDAAEYNRPEIADLILRHGADATTMDAEDGLDPSRVNVKTALHVAAWKGHRTIFHLLLKYALQQCDEARLTRFINRPNSVGKTALIDAAERDRPEMMKILLEEPYNANWSITTHRGHNALHHCAFRGHRKCVDLLLRYAYSVGDDGKPGSSSQSPLSKKRFAAFINQQSTPDLISPLHDITLQGFEDLAILLLETYGAEYEIYDVHGDSILHRAVQANHDELLVPYLAFMSKDKDQDKFKRVLLHKNKSQGRTVREACEVRGRGEWAALVKSYGG